MEIRSKRTILYSSSYKGFNDSSIWNAKNKTPMWQEVEITYTLKSDKPQQTCLKGKEGG